MNKEMVMTGMRVFGWFGIASAAALVAVVVLVLAQPGNADDRETLAKAAIYQQLQQRAEANK